MKKTGRIMAIVLAAVIFILIPSNALAAENKTNVSVSETDTLSKLPSVEDAISLLLQSMAGEAEEYGLKAEAFDKLYLGKPLPVYVYVHDQQLIPSAIEYYPIMFDGDVIAVATVWYNEEKTPIANISCYLAKAINEHGKDKEIALISANNEMMLWNGKSIIPSTSMSKTLLQTKLIRAVEQTAITREQPEPNKRLKIAAVKATQNYLSVPKVKQPTSNSCWAACTKSIGGYFGINKSILQIYGYAGVTPYNGGSLMTAESVLTASPFNLNSTWALAGAWAPGLSFATLQYYIDSGFPIFASSAYSDTAGHAVVIRGYYNYSNSNTYAGSISYMNPWTGLYEASNVAKSGARPFVFTDQAGAYLSDLADFTVYSD